jgi:hypothetical protein
VGEAGGGLSGDGASEAREWVGVGCAVVAGGELPLFPFGVESRRLPVVWTVAPQMSSATASAVSPTDARRVRDAAVRESMSLISPRIPG